MRGRIDWLARRVALFGVAAVVANCSGKSEEREGSPSGGNAGAGNHGGDGEGNRSGSGGAASGSGGVGVGGTTAGEAGAQGGGAASGSAGMAGSGGLPAGGQGGEAGSDQMAGGSGEGGAGGHNQEPTCEQVRLPITFRDFNAFTQTNGHRDFGPAGNGRGAVMGLVHPELDEDGKPVLVAASAPSFLHTPEEFAQWYRDTPEVNAKITRELVLWNDGAGKFTNRFGMNGERWRAQTGEPPAELDGAPLFFPFDDQPNALLETRFEGRVAAQYGWPLWPSEIQVAVELGISASFETAWAPFPSDFHNFNFTSELKFTLRHDAAVTTTIGVQGDDDIWVFVNGRLAVDLGSFHVPMPGSITIAGDNVTTSSQVGMMTSPTVATAERTAAEFGLVDGEPYEIAIFHAERQEYGATFLLSVSGVDWTESFCMPSR